MEHPQPPVRLTDPDPGLVARQHGAALQALFDGLGLGREGIAAGAQNADQAALADGEPEQIAQHL
jgi:hypothetical protein